LSSFFPPNLVLYGDQQAQPIEMVEQFKAETVFWEQLEIGPKIVLAKDARVLPLLESWLVSASDALDKGTAVNVANWISAAA
jgi:hypothetical protein